MELAESIKAQGVLQPLLVKKDDSSDSFILIAGERRFRAARRKDTHAQRDCR